MAETKRIVLEANKAPLLEGMWTVAEVQAAAEFLARWIGAQTISTTRQSDGPSAAATDTK